jgi:DNA-binding transcriptional ArsR family regulator
MAKPSRKPQKEQGGAATELNRAVDALAHPTRRGIVLMLHARGGAMPAGMIAERFKHAWPTVTRHLRVLEDAGIVAVQDEGRQRLYRLRTEPLRAVRDWIDAVCTPNPLTGSEDPAHWTKLPYGVMRNTIPPPRPE